MPHAPLIIVGLSGSGKTAVARMLVEKAGCIKIITTTTRAPRPGERDGVEYHFLSKERFQEKKALGDFLEDAVFSGEFYGTQKQDLESAAQRGSPVIVLEEQGAAVMKQMYPETKIIVLETSEVVRAARMQKEGMNQDTLSLRLERDRTRLPALEKIADIKINNDGNFEDTLRQLRDHQILVK